MQAECLTLIYVLGFSKREILVSWEAIISKGAKGGGKFKILNDYKTWFTSNFETCTRYSWVVDKEKNKKKGLRCFVW